MTVPWQNENEWRQILQSFQVLKQGHPEGFEILLAIAVQIREKYDAISSMIDQVCSNTCVNCTDICCKKATIWYDFTDLLYLYLSGRVFPSRQIYRVGLTGDEKKCCNLSGHGCIKLRDERPFVCTWYFCPDQIHYLKTHQPDKKAVIDSAIDGMKRLRAELENGFLKI